MQCIVRAQRVEHAESAEKMFHKFNFFFLYFVMSVKSLVTSNYFKCIEFQIFFLNFEYSLHDWQNFWGTIIYLFLIYTYKICRDIALYHISMLNNIISDFFRIPSRVMHLFLEAKWSIIFVKTMQIWWDYLAESTNVNYILSADSLQYFLMYHRLQSVVRRCVYWPTTAGLTIDNPIKSTHNTAVVT